MRCYFALKYSNSSVWVLSYEEIYVGRQGVNFYAGVAFCYLSIRVDYYRFKRDVKCGEEIV